MDDPALKKSQQLVREAKIGLTICALLVALFVYVSWNRFTGNWDQLPESVMNAPIAMNVADEYRKDVMEAKFGRKETDKVVKNSVGSSNSQPTTVSKTIAAPSSPLTQNGLRPSFNSNPKVEPKLDSQVRPAQFETDNSELAVFSPPTRMPAKSSDPFGAAPKTSAISPSGTSSNFENGFQPVSLKKSEFLNDSNEFQAKSLVVESRPIPRNELKASAAPKPTSSKAFSVSARSSFQVEVLPDTADDGAEDISVQPSSTESSAFVPTLTQMKKGPTQFVPIVSPTPMEPVADSLSKSPKMSSDISTGFQPAATPVENNSFRVDNTFDGFKPMIVDVANPSSQPVIEKRVIEKPDNEKTFTLAPTPTAEEMPVKDMAIKELPSRKEATQELASSFAAQTKTSSIDSAEETLERPITLGGTYEVQAGESFWHVAEKAYGDGRFFRALYEASRMRIDNPDQLAAGTRLQIPEKAYLLKNYASHVPDDLLPTDAFNEDFDYVTQQGDTLFGIARARLGQASRFNELFQLNRSRLPHGTNHLSELPLGMRIQLPEQH